MSSTGTIKEFWIIFETWDAQVGNNKISMISYIFKMIYIHKVQPLILIEKLWKDKRNKIHGTKPKTQWLLLTCISEKNQQTWTMGSSSSQGKEKLT